MHSDVLKFLLGRLPSLFLQLTAFFFLLLGPWAGKASSATLEMFPSDAKGQCPDRFVERANALGPGDDLVLHGGLYSQSCRRAISIHGTSDHPIVIQAAPGEIPVFTNSNAQNNLEIVNSSYLVIKGIHFQGASQGVRFLGDNHHITFEDNEVSGTSNNALALNSGNSDVIVIRHNHIHHTGLASDRIEWEGIYFGCHDKACRATNSMIEGNYIHHLRGTSPGGNDGIEVKPGSYGNTIRHNVIHDTNIGTSYPCISLYGGGTSENVAEGNVMWNCGEGIYVVSDAVVRNNIILSSQAGIASYPHIAVGHMRNVIIANNTLYGHEDCFLLRWEGGTNLVLANNAAYCEGTTVVNGRGLQDPQITILANFVSGKIAEASIDQRRFFAGGKASTTFVNAPRFNLWPRPTSSWIGTADPTFAPPVDFNQIPRTSSIDVGAYESNGATANPGWLPIPGFKPLPSSPVQKPSLPHISVSSSRSRP